MAKSFDLVDDGVGRRRPDKRFAVVVVMVQVRLDLRLERPDIFERAPANALRGDLRKEPFDLVQPARACRREMEMIAGVAQEPPDHFRHLMRAVVVHDDMHVARRRQLRVEALEDADDTRR